jgi:hypothetical protein
VQDLQGDLTLGSPAHSSIAIFFRKVSVVTLAILTIQKRFPAPSWSPKIMTNVLADKDVNAPVEQQHGQSKNVKSMEYHRQVLQSKMAEDSWVSSQSSQQWHVDWSKSPSQIKAIRVAFGQHHEPLHGQDQCSAQQARQQVSHPLQVATSWTIER